MTEYKEDDALDVRRVRITFRENWTVIEPKETTVTHYCENESCPGYEHPPGDPKHLCSPVPECEVCDRTGLLEKTGGVSPLCPKCTEEKGSPVCHVHGECPHGYAGSIVEWRRRLDEAQEKVRELEGQLAVPQADLRDINDAGIVEIRAEPLTVWVNVDGRCVLRVFPPWPGEDKGRERLRVGLDVNGMAESWWLYVPEHDEAGIVIPGSSAKEALKNARDAGWSPGPNEVFAFALLGDPVALGIVEGGDDDDE